MEDDPYAEISELFGLGDIKMEDIEDVYFVEIYHGEYPAPEPNKVVTHPSERPTKKYKHHITHGKYNTATEEVNMYPKRVCSHETSPPPDDVELLMKAIERGDTSKQRICQDCLNSLPSDIRDQIQT